ncbi:MAG TPA: hypothetical protein VMW21_01250 [Patescibacteria group bacterium]|nr:hypothetical protein [Patescibacteria group bacterium]
MSEEYTKEELQKLYAGLPEELKEAIFSVETADNIYNICTKNKIGEDKISEIAKYVGFVLFGILLAQNFQETLEKELKIEKEAAENIAAEINQLIFYPVKPVLQQLYKKEAELAEGAVEKPVERIREESPRKDIYKEPVE